MATMIQPNPIYLVYGTLKKTSSMMLTTIATVKIAITTNNFQMVVSFMRVALVKINGRYVKITPYF